MPRYSICLSYNGTHYSGWQIQNNARSIQGEIEQVLHTVTGQEINVVGCGRTDAGVHAKNYVAHFDIDHIAGIDLLYKLNRMLDTDIVVHSIDQVDHTFHARFDATSRSYQYIIRDQKDPFLQDGYYHCTYMDKLDREKLHNAANLILAYQEFFPFCKANSDAMSMKCAIKKSYWSEDHNSLIYHVTANRFLRGMVRLLVGMCINVSLGKLDILAVRDALDQQKRLGKPWSVPASGLYLMQVTYPNLSEI